MTQSSFSILGLPVLRQKLPSGMTLLLQASNRAPICSIHIWVRAGSADDPNGCSGLAHFLEHLMFTGTPKHPEGQLDHWVEENGGHLNAATWLDWTYYHAELPSDLLTTFLAFEADRFQHLLLEPERLERERQVVLNERREQVEDDPETILSEQLWFRVFEGMGYGRPTIGSKDEIRQLSREDCLNYYNKAYNAANLVVSISGQFDDQAVRRIIEQQFLGLNAQPKDTHLQLNCYTPGFHGEIAIASKAEKLYVGLPAPPLESLDHAALEIVHHTLLEGESGRLQRLLVSELEIVSYAFGFLPSLRYDSLYEMGFDLRPDASTHQLLEQLKVSLNSLIKDGITSQELERARNRIELDAIEGLQTVEQRAHSLGFWEVVVGDCRFTGTRLEQYASLTVAQVNRAIERWWGLDKMAWIIGRCEF